MYWTVVCAGQGLHPILYEIPILYSPCAAHVPILYVQDRGVCRTGTCTGLARVQIHMTGGKIYDRGAHPHKTTSHSIYYMCVHAPRPRFSSTHNNVDLLLQDYVWERKWLCVKFQPSPPPKHPPTLIHQIVRFHPFHSALPDSVVMLFHPSPVHVLFLLFTSLNLYMQLALSPPFLPSLLNPIPNSTRADVPRPPLLEPCRSQTYWR